MSIHIDHIKRLGLWALAAATAALAGCTGDADIEDPLVGRPSEYLSFTATLASGDSSGVSRGTSKHLETEIAQWALETAPASRKDTRGSLTTALSGNAGVMGFMDTDTGGKTAFATGNKFVFNGNTLAAADTPIRWNTINKGKMDIFVCAPYAVTVDRLTVNDAYEPTLSYTVPNTVADHKDIIVSKLQGAGVAEHKNKAIPLTFDHALTAVRFKVGFDCTVKSVKLEGVYNKGKYNFSSGLWTPDITSTDSYTVDFGTEGKSFAKNAMLTDGENTMILLPQTLPNDAKITLTCTDNTDNTDNVYTASIKGTTWEAGKLITYTLYDQPPVEPIYFDLAADNVIIKVDGSNNSTYSGKVFKDTDNNGTIETVDVKGTHTEGTRYYVYQSTETNRGNIWKDGTFTRPTYGEIEVEGRPWREFITNNNDVESVIDNWSKGKDALAQNADREGTPYRIDISGKVTCELTIDNIYSTHQINSTSRTTAGISFVPEKSSTGAKGAKVTIKMLGDNRVGAVHYANNSDNGNEIIFEGPGSLTVADVDGILKTAVSGDDIIGIETGKTGYYSNHWCSAIGGNDGGATEEKAYGIVINSGTIFAGTTKAENCTAIGGGGNSHGQVTINGGTVTAVATTTGAAIGGGIGFRSSGGTGNVTIMGGNVYAYNLENRWGIPSSAIGGAGSRDKIGNTGIVTISGGYVYAYSALGTAIGGGSSFSEEGGDATIKITGGEVIAKTGSSVSASIGGGTAFSKGGSSTGSKHYSGGSADIKIGGNPIIRTGSIGGGGTGDQNGNIGNATINVWGGDTQAQFILAAGTGEGVNSFTMTGGKIQGVDTGGDTGDGTDGGYLYVKKDGGAVYLENGTVTISGGTIENCRAERGGAIYITGTENSIFEMTGGTIQNNVSNSDGGAVYLENGTVTISGGTIDHNLAVGGNGGGICISGGSLEMPKEGSAYILYNSAEAKPTDGAFVSGNGGGVYISSAQTKITAKLLSGTISDNTADRKGGGVCVYMDSETLQADVSVGFDGGGDNSPNISNNHALIQGGGLYAEGKNARIVINSGTILNNTVSQYVYNSDVANERGQVTLNNGKVTHVEVKFFANDGKSSNTEPQHIQKIVTSTNSTLEAPVFHRRGYKIVGWNTKPSGRGDNYTDGQLMNIKTDISLYAKWAIDVQ